MDKNMTLDVRGLSCPQPALLAKQTLGELKQGTLQVLLDSATACDNVSRIAHNNGWTVKQETDEQDFRLILSK